MIVAIHQPDYLPYPGFFYKIYRCDTFVFLDDAQYSNTGMHNVNRIKTSQGALSLKVPVKQTLGDLICDVTTRDNLNWKRKHLRTIALNYCKAPFYRPVYDIYKQLLTRDYDSIADMNEAIILRFCKEVGLERKFVRSSALGVNSSKEQRLVDICVKLGADVYYSGTGAKDYLTGDLFKEAGITLVYSDYRPIVYPQPGHFIPNLSILDYFFNCGFNLNFDVLPTL